MNGRLGCKLGIAICVMSCDWLRADDASLVDLNLFKGEGWPLIG